MNRSVTFALLFLASLPALAQTLTGTVREASASPASFAALKLLRATDSSFVAGTIADEQGQYRFSNLSDGRYRVQASVVGMRNETSPVVTVRAGQPLTLEPLQLQPASQALTTVTIRAQKPLVEQQIDKTVLNVASDATAQGKSAYELLQQAPGVVIDPNDNIQMAGKRGATVFIDGKPTNLSAADLANLLRATPASGIETVELISNPSARYDAQGGAGIINIKRRRDKTLGLNGRVSGGYGQSDHHRANAALDLNYRAQHVNLFGNAAVSDNFQITNVLIDRYATGTRFLQRGYDSDGTRAIVYKAGVDYFMGTRHTLGLILSGNSASNQFGTYTTTGLTNSRGVLDSSLINRVTNPSLNNRLNASLNYRYTDTSGLELNVDIDFTRFGNAAPNTITSDYVNPTGDVLLRRRYRFDARTDITISTVKGDLVKAWKTTRTELETGFKHTDVSTDNDLLAFLGGGQSGTPEQPDRNRTNRFQYREQVSAGYASLKQRLGKKWMAQAGLRIEHATVRGRSTDILNGTGSSNGTNKPDTSYVNLFPSAFLQYQASEKNQFSVKYGRRIGRPNYQDLNPFIYQIDPYTSQRGNPFLRPDYTQNTELSYTYNQAMTVSLGYNHTTDFSTDVVRQEKLVAYQTVANVGQVNAVNLSVNAPLPIRKWWNGYVYAGATWNRFQGHLSPIEPFDQRAFAFQAYMQHSFTLSNQWVAQVSGFWNAPTTQTIYRIGGMGSINLSIQKKVLDGRGNVSLLVDDVLNQMRYRQTANYGTAPDNRQQFYIDRKWESRRVSLRFSYRFGSTDVKENRNRETGPDASRIKTKANL